MGKAYIIIEFHTPSTSSAALILGKIGEEFKVYGSGGDNKR